MASSVNGANGNGSTMPHGSNGSTSLNLVHPVKETTSTRASTSSAIKGTGTVLRSVLIDIPLMLLFASLLSALLIQHAYHTHVKVIIDSFRHGDTDYEGFYDNFENEMTYYNRQCDAQDITTRDANDLIVSPDMTGEEGAHVMMKHGAVMFKNVLTNETASELRAYLERRNVVREQLPWHEKFWEGERGERLALGLGAHDDPVITEALRQVGNHEVVKRTIEAIMGEDPAIVEISTMTSMHGAPDQGIHSDSDYFGSSNLYARKFLHSYTMFMALQDTTSKMGATTICAGTHHCANPDLEQVCLENGAFEVSSNGYTGRDEGVLLKGDAMMFNQNVWHRGAQNYDPDHNLNRVMFIITFLTRTKETPGDYRQQALGTYYYQRWNMWGHTFEDLKDVGTVMRQPMAALRALGLYKPAGRKLGVTFIEQFARQAANHMDFYAPYELPEMIEYMDDIGIPKFLQGQSYDWEPFLEELMSNWVVFLAKVNAGVLGIYLGLRLLVWIAVSLFAEKTETTQKRQWIPSLVKRLVFTHGATLLLFYGLMRFVDQSYLAQCAKSGELFIRPFPEEAAPNNLDLGPTTFPEREDVLIGTRFDADWLGVYNDMLDYHPGNIRFNDLVASFATLPKSLLDQASRTVVEFIQKPIARVSPRFLLQDPGNGFWTLMHDAAVLQVTRRSIMMEQSGLDKRLGKHLLQVLADSRFGPMRDTKMAQKFTPLFVEKWQHILFNDAPATVEPNKFVRVPTTAPSGKSSLSLNPSVVPELPSASNRNQVTAAWRKLELADITIPLQKGLQVGDRVSASYNQRGEWAEGKILEIYSADEALVQFHNGYYAELSSENIREFEPLVEGDVVEAEFEGQAGDWNVARIVNAHPLGLYAVEYEEDGFVEQLSPHNIRRLEQGEPVVFSSSSQEHVLEVGQRVRANYRGEGEWFLGTILNVNEDGSFDVGYDDGDHETEMPRHRVVRANA